MTSYWLLKSEPSTYSIDHFAKDQQTQWTGVRNYQARNLLRDQLKDNDQILFYHSSTDLVGVAGLGRVVEAGLVDPTQFVTKSEYFDAKASKEKPIWYAPRIEFIEKFREIVSLEKMRQQKSLEKMLLLKRGTRLSVQPVSESEFKFILKMAK